MRKTNTLHVVGGLTGRILCGFGWHYFCDHPATVVTQEGVKCARCECEMEYIRNIRGWRPVSPVKPCLRGCGKIREEAHVRRR